MPAGEEPGASHVDERLGDAIMLAVLLFAFCAYWLLSRKPQGLLASQEERGRARQGDHFYERGVCFRSGMRGTGLLGPI